MKSENPSVICKENLKVREFREFFEFTDLGHGLWL